METRLAAVFRVQADGVCVNVAQLCSRLGISRDSFYRYRRRYEREGLAGLVPRSRRPHTSPARTSAVIEDEVVRLRKELPCDNGAWSIRQHLLATTGSAPAASTVHRVLVDRGLVVAQPQKRPKSSWRRFSFPNPDDCWQMDATEWSLAGGTTVVIFDVEDDCSRLALASWACPAETGQAAWDTVCAAFAEFGMPGMMLTDNGTVFTNRFGLWPGLADFEANLAGLGIKLVNSSPYHPQTCGKVERFHQTAQRWLRRHPPAASISQLQKQLDAFRDYYNTRRPHHALRPAGNPTGLADTPAQRYAAIPNHGRPAAGPMPEPVFIHRPLVSATGLVSISKWRIKVGTRWRGHTLLALRQGHHVWIWAGSQLIRELTIDPARRYQPAAVTPPADTSTPTPAHSPDSRHQVRPPRRSQRGAPAAQRGRTTLTPTSGRPQSPATGERATS